jgi:hypothetical protein
MKMLDWIRTNKDILPIAVAFISSIAALAAVLIAPSVQLWISRRQLRLQKQSIDLTGAQISANIKGGADQKWSDSLRETILEIESLITERGVIQKTRTISKISTYGAPRELEINTRLPLLFAKVRLLVGSSAPDYVYLVGQWASQEELATRIQIGTDVFKQTSEMIEHRNSLYASYIDSVLSPGKVHQRLP